jgi:hypothetical protein
VTITVKQINTILTFTFMSKVTHYIKQGAYLLDDGRDEMLQTGEWHAMTCRILLLLQNQEVA